MHDQENGHSPALNELHRRLALGLAQSRLNQKQLAAQARLGRTTVSEALSINGPVPSAATVVMLAGVLKLSVPELLELQRTAAAESGTTTGQDVGLGKPINLWDPHELEVHPAGPGDAASSSAMTTVRALPGYVPREHDRVLDDAVRDVAAGRSRILVLVGTSSTGKTRACWEAVQPLAERGWRLWHPFDPTRAEAALEELCRVGPRTVVWLNEAQHYLGDQSSGERIAAAVHRLLVDEQCGPVLVLGTLWPEYAADYTALPTPGGQDSYSRVRELLAGRTLAVSDAFDAAALATAAGLAENGDRLLADALTRAGEDGRITQDLAGAPELLNRYEHASPAARALLETAMDARRLGVGLHLPQTFLTDAAPDYLTDTEYDQLTDDWVERAYAELANLVHGKQAPLRRTRLRPQQHPPAPSASSGAPVPPHGGLALRLADYLEQHGRTTRRHLCPPASFWHAAHSHLTHSDDLHNLTRAAEQRHRLQWAHHLRHRAADRGSTDALERLAEMRKEAGDRDGAVGFLRQAADHGSARALERLAEMRMEAGDRDGAVGFLRQAADHGSTYALVSLAMMEERTNHGEDAGALLRQAAERNLATVRERAGRPDGADALLRQAVDRGSTDALERLAEMRKEAGDRDRAEGLLRQAADRGSTRALVRLAMMREEAGDVEGAETFLRQAANYGNTGLYRVVGMQKLLGRLWPFGLEPNGTPTPPWQP